MAREHGEDLRHCFPWKKWLVWDGRRWRQDDTGEATRRAKRVIRNLFDEATARMAEIGKELEEMQE
jgi:putative DNA primase/helicase